MTVMLIKSLLNDTGVLPLILLTFGCMHRNGVAVSLMRLVAVSLGETRCCA